MSATTTASAATLPVWGARGRVITVLSPKGGVGKTTVATNLAVGLALDDPHSTVLVDLDVQFGDVATALNLTPRHTIVDAVHGPAAADPMVLKTVLTQHPTGLYVVCGVDDPAEADQVSGDHIRRLLTMLAGEFRNVVVDTAPGLGEHTLAALDATTDPVVLSSMDVPGVRELRAELRTLRSLGMFPDGVFVALNFVDRRGGLTVADVEATVEAPVQLQLPRSKGVTASVNLGVPLLQSGGGRDPMAKALRTLVSRFTVDRTRRRGRHLGGRR